MNSKPRVPKSFDQGNTYSAAFNYEGWREQFILTVLRIACVLGIALIVASYTAATSGERISFISLYAVLVAVTILPAPYRIRAVILLAANFAIGMYTILNWGVWSDGSLFLLVTVVLSSLLFSRRIDIIVFGINIIAILTIATLQQLEIFSLINARAPTIEFKDWAFFLIDFSIAGILIVVAIGQFKEEFTRVIQEMQSTFNTLTSERTQLEDRVHQRTEELEMQTKQLRTSTSVARIVAEIQNISELMETVTKLISEKFEYYHVGLYILDEYKKTAFLQAASSAIGKQLVGQGFRIEPDRRNAINTVVEQNRPYISSDGNANFVRDVNFPITRSRMTLPLAVRGNVIGILDIHSDQTQAFNMQDAEILQTLSDLVAISFDNVRLLNETKNLVNQLEINTSFQTREIWSKLTSRRKSAYQYTPAGVRPVFSTDKQDGEDGLRIPLILYGQNIGTIKLKRKGDAKEWSERERTLVEKIADQVALALENSRLVDEAQKGALRDQMIANISNRVRETLDVESVVRTAATELRRVFDLKEAEISIGSPQAEAAPIRKSTGALRLK
ncbi:MAG: GAF domain-containing protein [Anaerolineales bacterium]|nr:GAF domain-containing protein [Anaerolineales bacterium]